jgi:Fe-S-cluster containining protein
MGKSRYNTGMMLARQLPSSPWRMYSPHYILQHGSVLLGLMRRLMQRGIIRVAMWLGVQPPTDGLPLVGEYYTRTGSCNQCGQCCQNIYLTYRRKVIETDAEFNAIKQLHPQEYGTFEPLEQGSKGLVFQCTALGSNNQCTQYEARPSFCRTYPTEDALLAGSKLPVECSYQFQVHHTFQQVLKDVR